MSMEPTGGKRGTGRNRENPECHNGVWVNAFVERFGGLDSLVTNAGGPPAGGFESFADEDWQRAFDLNLMSVVRLIQAALPNLRESDSPRIVNFTSSSIKQPIQNLLLSNVFRTAVLAPANTYVTGQALLVDEGMVKTL